MEKDIPELDQLDTESQAENKLLFEQIATFYAFDLDDEDHFPWYPAEIYPSEERYLLDPSTYKKFDIQVPWEDTKTPHPPIIEVMGLPESGKSELIGYLSEIYSNLCVSDEFSTGSIGNIKSPLYLKNLLLTGHKRNELYNAVVRQVHNEEEFLNQPNLFVRGPNDILAFSIPLYLRNTPFMIPFELVVRSLILETVSQLSYVDAVILYGNDLETAERRRLRQGKTKYGEVVTPNIWNTIEFGYSWWLEYIYPLLQLKFGTGLLVVDGRYDLKKNNRMVYKYIKNILKRAPQK